jgi:hypothetical protein
MNSIIKVVSLVFLFLAPEFLLACSCAGISSFCRTVEGNKVVEIRILEKYTDDKSYTSFLDIEVLETLLDTSGSIQKFMTIVESGTSCDIGISGWASVGDRYVMTFTDTFNYEGANFPGLGFYQCSTNFLKIENNFVTGAITRTDGSEERLRYAELKKMISNLCEFESLLEKDVYINSLAENRQLVIKNLNQSSLEYNIFDAAGKLVMRKTIDPKEEQELNLSQAAAGLYFINFRNKNDQITKKFVLN